MIILYDTSYFRENKIIIVGKVYVQYLRLHTRVMFTFPRGIVSNDIIWCHCNDIYHLMSLQYDTSQRGSILRWWSMIMYRLIMHAGTSLLTYSCLNVRLLWDLRARDLWLGRKNFDYLLVNWASFYFPFSFANYVL